MAIQRCKNGHYYNTDESQNCPYCTGESPIGKTIPLDGNAGNVPNGNVAPSGFGATVDLTQVPRNIGSVSIGVTQPVTGVPANNSMGQTITLGRPEGSDVLPVKGWLVVIEGPKCGQDFRIHTGDNSIGRDKSNAVALDFDASVSREKICSINYDERNNVFHIVKVGETINNIYVNNEALLVPRKLEDYDVIEVGETKLVFRSFCNTQFNYAPAAKKE